MIDLKSLQFDKINTMIDSFAESHLLTILKTLNLNIKVKSDWELKTDPETLYFQ